MKWPDKNFFVKKFFRVMGKIVLLPQTTSFLLTLF